MRVGIVVVIAAGYLTLLLANVCDFAAGPDSSGYLSHARLITEGRTAATIEPLVEGRLPHQLARLFTPYGFTPGQRPGTMVPTYPVGAPLHFAAAAAIGGWGLAPFLVNPLAAVGALCLFVLLARELGIGTWSAVAGAVLLAAMPVFLGSALVAMSDVLATFWALAAMLCAVKARKDTRWAVIAGVGFAIGVAVRPTNALVLAAILPALGMHARRVAAFFLAVAPLAAAMMLYHASLFGSPFATGYGREIVRFAGLPCLGAHAKNLAWLMTPLVFPGGLAVAALRSVDRWKRVVLIVWPLVFIGFYGVYAYCPDAASSRFLLPALPPLILGLLLVLRVRRAVFVAVVLLILAREVVLIGRMHTLHADEWEAIYPQTVASVNANVPRDAVVLSAIVSGALYHDGGRTSLRWDQLDPALAAELRRNPRFAGVWYAVVSDVEGGVAHLRARVPGHWVQVGRIRDVSVWEWRGGFGRAGGI